MIFYVMYSEVGIIRCVTGRTGTLRIKRMQTGITVRCIVQLTVTASVRMTRRTVVVMRITDDRC